VKSQYGKVTRLPLRHKKACGTSVWFLMGGLMPLLTMGVKENNCGVVLSLSKRRDTVGKLISTFLTDVSTSDFPGSCESKEIL
jgi:hypothetical protein